MLEDVDVILLSRDQAPLRERVRHGIEAQNGVRLRMHRAVGVPRPDDPNRWATIARARNAGKRLGTFPWVLFLDDDVVLGQGCVARLVEALRQRPAYAALAADYLGELGGARESWPGPQHVGMGATLFRREVLAYLVFRWEPGKCECQCCCDDLRRAGFGIGYLPEAGADHERSAGGSHGVHPTETGPEQLDAGSPFQLPARVLAAFDRHHLNKFRRQFLRTLRASGNPEPVTAVGYGLLPSEQRVLASMPGVEVIAVPDNGVVPAIRRLRNFQDAVARWPEDAPIAYWDAGDVVFQDRLTDLWNLVRANPDRLLAVPEPFSYPENPAVVDWTCTIQVPDARQRAFALLSTHPFLNGGFAAGTARALLRYLREADRLLHSSELRGTADWGDQTAMNLYCHANPERWLEIAAGWNYCLFMRGRRDYRILQNGKVESGLGLPIQVVHGNAKTLRQLELSFFV